MKKITTILSPLVLLATTALAQDSTCILQPSCSQLGYTSSETDCGTQKVLRCPFDVSQVACVGGGSSSDSGGSGDSGDSGEDDSSSPTCNVGDIYYDDDTCSSTFDIQKNAIGIVFDTTYKYIVDLSHKLHYWSRNYPISSDITIPQLSPTDVSVARDFNGKAYTEQLVASANTYYAAEYCAGLTTGGKDWFLPSGGQMYLLAQQRTAVNTGLGKVNFGTVNTLGYEEYYTSAELEEDYDLQQYFYNYWTSNVGTSSGYAIYYCMEPGSTSFGQDKVNELVYVYDAGTTSHESYISTRCIAEY